MRTDIKAIKKSLKRYTPLKISADNSFTRAGVLMPIIDNDKSIDILLTLRTYTVEHHKGQISFPGGTMDMTDKSIMETALRETDEELGLPPKMIEIAGILDEFTTPTGFLITPIVGILRKIPPIKINSNEVEDAFTIPLYFFLDTNNLRTEVKNINGKMQNIYYYKYKNRTIWGATAKIIRNLIEITG